MAQEATERLLTMKEACELLGCHRNTLIGWDESGYLKAVRIGTRKDRRYRLSQINQLINQQEGGHDGEASL